MEEKKLITVAAAPTATATAAAAVAVVAVVAAGVQTSCWQKLIFFPLLLVTRIN